MEDDRVPCVGAVVHDRDRLLMIRRGSEPGLGLWSVPGGRVEPGETGVQAVVREVEEETGLLVEPVGLAGTVERAGPGGTVYVIDDYVAVLAPNADPTAARPGDDADEVGWFTAEEAQDLPCVDGLLEALRGWGVL